MLLKYAGPGLVFRSALVMCKLLDSFCFFARRFDVSWRKGEDAEYMLFEGYAIACAKIAPESDSCGVSWMS